jgi:hypothetical protein
MGINDEYSRDAYYEQTWDSDDSDQEVRELHPEDWQDMHSRDLMNGWIYLQEYIHDNYLDFRNCQYHNFVELVVDSYFINSNQNYSEHSQRAWTKVRRVRIIRQKVQPEAFCRWFDNYVCQ